MSQKQTLSFIEKQYLNQLVCYRRLTVASGYDLSSKHTFRLMQGRLGIYDKRPYNPQATDPEIQGVVDQATRLRFNGGNKQQERMIKDKRRSLDRAVWNSYQAAEVVRTDAENKKPVRALINPNKLKQDYDDKIISIGYEYNFKPGDTFEWLGTRSHWIIYLQDTTELAYFRGDIRKCSHQISWEDENGRHSTYAAIRGPVETKINFIQKHGISVDSPNYSLNILMPSNKASLEYFRRYAKFYLQNNQEGAENICWRVEAIDWISTPGILEVNAVEYYSNKDEDDVEEGVVGGLIVEPENPNSSEVEISIIGDTFIKPKKTYEYEFNGEGGSTWKVDKKFPVVIEVDPLNSNHIFLKWNSTYSGQFDLTYGDFTKTIVVESLF